MHPQYHTGIYHGRGVSHLNLISVSALLIRRVLVIIPGDTRTRLYSITGGLLNLGLSNRKFNFGVLWCFQQT